MEETYSNICKKVYENKNLDISNSPECIGLYRKIANKYLIKYKKHNNNNLESCKNDILDYSVKYFCQRLHGKPQGKVAENINDYSKNERIKDETTLPILSERQVLDLEKQKELIEHKEQIYRNIFSGETRKILFSVSTIQKNSGTNIIDLKSKSIVDLKNVIGFNLLQANIPITFYNINTANKARVSSGAAVSSADNGYWTSSDLTTITDINSYDTKTGKLTYGQQTLTTGITAEDKSIAKVLGLSLNAAGTQYVSGTGNTSSADRNDKTVVIDVRSTTHIDVEIKEIPSISCKNTEFSNNIISRIPIRESFGGVENYTANSTDILTEYFNPIKLPRITLKLMDEFGIELDFNGIDSHFVFEAVVLKNIPDMGIFMEN